jgi:hypothetical protein
MRRPLRDWYIEGVHQLYVLDKTGMPVTLDTELHIRALKPLKRILYVFNTNELHVEGIRGCTAGEIVRDGYEPDKYWAVAIELEAHLEKDQTTALAHRTVFHYSSPPPNELVQSGGTRGAERVNLNVQFHPKKLPRLVKWELRNASGALVKSSPLELTERAVATFGTPALPPQYQLFISWEW